MRNGMFPIFTKGRVLKKESIEYLRDFPHDMAALAWGDYSDGILFGFTVSYKNGFLLISKGAVKYQGEIIVISENALSVKGHSRLSFIKLVMGKFHETEDFKTCPIEIVVDNNEAASDHEIELGRFCLESGADLRCKYDSFSDLRTPENTLDVTRVPYAGKGAPTLHPAVMREYGAALMMGSPEAADLAFAMMCLNTDVIHKNSIQWYIAIKNDNMYEDFLLESLYGRLLEILPEQRRNRKEQPLRRRVTIS